MRKTGKMSLTLGPVMRLNKDFMWIEDYVKQCEII